MNKNIFFSIILILFIPSFSLYAQYTQSNGDYLRVNGYQSITVDVGNKLSYEWGGVDGMSYESFYTADRADACPEGIDKIGVTKSWFAHTTSGSITKTVEPCQAGITYTIVYRIYKTNNQVITRNIVLKVTGEPVSLQTKTKVLAQATSTQTTTVSPIANGQFVSNVKLQTAQAQEGLFASIKDVISSYRGKLNTKGTNGTSVSIHNVSSATSTSHCKLLTENMAKGSIGDQVIILTKQLVIAGFLDTEQNIFDDTVFNAVVGFQEQNKDVILTPHNLSTGTGFVGSSTRAVINKNQILNTSCK